MDFAIALLISSLLFLLLLAVLATLLLSVRWLVASLRETQASFLREVKESRVMQQATIDETMTSLLTTTPSEYAQIRNAKIQEAAQRSYLASVQYTEQQAAQEKRDSETAKADQVAILDQFEQEQEELDAISGSVYGGVA